MEAGGGGGWRLWVQREEGKEGKGAGQEATLPLGLGVGGDGGEWGSEPPDHWQRLAG